MYNIGDSRTVKVCVKCEYLCRKEVLFMPISQFSTNILGNILECEFLLVFAAQTLHNTLNTKLIHQYNKKRGYLSE